jgi:hypothetical protein
MMTSPDRLLSAACPTLAAALLLLAAPAADARPTAAAAGAPAWSAAAPAAVPFAADEGSGTWSYRRFIASLGSRTGVVRLCVIVMCLALFILMRKFAPPGPGGPAGPRRTGPTRNHR